MVLAVGAGMVGGGAVIVGHVAGRTTKGCSSVGVSLHGTAGASFVPHCFDPGMAMVGGLVLVIGGAVLFLWAASAMVRSWGQRVHRRALGPDVLPPLAPTGTGAGPNGSDAASVGTGLPSAPRAGAAPPAAIGPAPGWYAMPPDGSPMWWDGRAWATAPTLRAVPTPAADAG